MTKKDVYESLLDMYGQSPLYTPKMADSLMKVLRLQFTPEEAELAIEVGLEGRKLDQIQERTGIERDRLIRMLSTMAEKGTMWISPVKEDPDYKTIDIAGPGLIETGAWGNVRFPHSVQLMKAMHKFQVDFATKRLAETPFPVARVWATPAALPKDAGLTENVAEMIKQADYWGVSACSCRLPHWIADPGNHCNHLLETCLFLGDMARWGIEHGMCRETTCDEALELLRKCNEDGLVHSFDPNHFICNCCSDCCVLQVGHREPGAKVLQPSEFVAQIDEQTCTACNICGERCPVGAIEVDVCASVDMETCLGCGVCFPTCATKSVTLVRRPKVEQIRAAATT
jgi:NAD-dependent dihydropyrimidine dehydrogenase PreA subunit